MRKSYYKITLPRLRTLEQKWRPSLTPFLNAIPGGLGIGHLLAESNGELNPPTRDPQRRPTGLMQIPAQEARRFRYSVTELQDPATSLQVWCLLTNRHAKWLHETFSDWTVPNIDFWVSVRAIFILGQTIFTNIFQQTKTVRGSPSSTADMLTWIVEQQRNTTLRFGGLTLTDLQYIAEHLKEIQTAIQTLDGPKWVGKRFSGSPGKTVTPTFAKLRSVSNAL